MENEEERDVTCPCCTGTGRLIVHEAREEGDEFSYPATCCHCQGSGRIFLDQRSDNRHE